MTPRKVFLDELTTSSRNYRVKAKVISKDRPQTGELRKVRYQGLVLLDEKGNKMRGALFGDQLQTFRDALVYNGTYEISDATIKPLEEKWKKDPSELNYQMGFGPKTLIQPMDTEEGPALPEYRAIGQIPKAGDPSDKFDVLGILMFVEKEPRQANLSGGRKVNVTEIVLMDHSTQQPLTVSAWGDLADYASETLVSKVGNFQVVGFTALRVSNHKGFSMSATMSTEIIQEPIGERVITLEKWSNNNTQKLMQIRARILHTRDAATKKIIITIAQLRLKRATNTLQDDRHWLRVTVPEVNFSKLITCFSCSKCGRQTDLPPEASFSCTFCAKDNCISIPRVTFSCDVTDGTGNLLITAYTDNTEKLFRLTAQDIFRIKHSNDVNSFEVARNVISTTTYLIKVGPKRSLSLSNILEWVLKQVVVEQADGEDRNELKEGAATTLQNKIDQVVPEPTHKQVTLVSGDKLSSPNTEVQQNADVDPDEENPDAVSVATSDAGHQAI